MMAKGFVSVRMDEELMRRLDAVAEATSDTRSAIVERLVRNGLDDAERFLKRFENPVLREAWGVLTSPGVLKALAAAAGEELTPEQLEAAAKGQRLVKRARKNRRDRSSSNESARPKEA